jgi:hypothetical protein
MDLDCSTMGKVYRGTGDIASRNTNHFELLLDQAHETTGSRVHRWSEVCV